MSLDFYQDQLHPCSYLSEQQARNIYPDPNRPVNKQLYSYLIQHGFRRSGDHVYRPHCPACSACVPVRIDTQRFKANRSQRRCLKKNQDISIKMRPASFNPEHFDLYRRYLAHRHAGGGMDDPTEENYHNFLLSSWSDTGLIEFSLESTVVAVAVTDFVSNGASAFYTFFDPAYSDRSLGTFAILKQIAIARDYQLDWLYLGYWIQQCQKMNYKTRFSALQGYDGEWRDFTEKSFE
jgi:arginine-tRNA-protein transferase